MNGTVIGAIAGYSPKNIKPWVESLEETGSQCRKIMIVYSRTPVETVDYLKEHGFEVYIKELKFPIMTQRFADYYKIIQGENVTGKVLITDIGDVIFQKDPFEYLKTVDNEMLFGDESIACKDMEWSARNYAETFPLEYPRIANNTSICAGVIAGDAEVIADFSLTVFKYAMTALMLYKFNETPDQAAVNVVLGLNIYKDYKVTNHDDWWVTHLGVSWEEKHDPFLRDKKPSVINGKVVNNFNDPFVIVHQYNRFEPFSTTIKDRYEAS